MGIAIKEVEKKIGAEALHKIVVRVFEETDRRKLEEFKRAVAEIEQHKRKQQTEQRKTQRVNPPRFIDDVPGPNVQRHLRYGGLADRDDAGLGRGEVEEG